MRSCDSTCRDWCPRVPALRATQPDSPPLSRPAEITTGGPACECLDSENRRCGRPPLDGQMRGPGRDRRGSSCGKDAVLSAGLCQPRPSQAGHAGHDFRASLDHQSIRHYVASDGGRGGPDAAERFGGRLPSVLARTWCRYSNVTLEQLATHTRACRARPASTAPPQGWNKLHVMQWLATWCAPYPPGTKSLYSNVAVGVLGFAIADREEQPLLEVWREQFLEPLEMRNTFFEIPPNVRPQLAQGYGPQGKPVPHDPPGGWPAGGRLNSSGRDMGQFLAANMNEMPQFPAITRAPCSSHSNRISSFSQDDPRTRLATRTPARRTGDRQERRTDRHIDLHRHAARTSHGRGRHGKPRQMPGHGVGRKLLMALIAREHNEDTPDEE